MGRAEPIGQPPPRPRHEDEEKQENEGQYPPCSHARGTLSWTHDCASPLFPPSHPMVGDGHGLQCRRARADFAHSGGGRYATDTGAHQALTRSVSVTDRRTHHAIGGASQLLLRSHVPRTAHGLAGFGKTGGDHHHAETWEAIRPSPCRMARASGALECQRARTARLFYELGLGRNFTDIREARPGDFLKVFWTDAVGQNERGHSVIYLGTEIVDGQEMVKYWSSNKPDGMGTRSVSRKKIAWMLFSRLEHRSESPPGRACRNPTPTSPRCYGWTPAAARRSSSRARRHRRLASRKNASYLFRMSRKIPVSAPQNPLQSSLRRLSRWTACRGTGDRAGARPGESRYQAPPHRPPQGKGPARRQDRHRREPAPDPPLSAGTRESPQGRAQVARCGGALNGREMELQGDQARACAPSLKERASSSAA